MPILHDGYVAYDKYSETCLTRPLKGPSKRGLCHQVVALSRVNILEIACLCPDCSGLLGQDPSGRLDRFYCTSIRMVYMLP